MISPFQIAKLFMNYCHIVRRSDRTVNQWFMTDNIRIYFRITKRLYPNQNGQLYGFEVSNVILKKELQHKLWFTKFITYILQHNPLDVIFVESVGHCDFQKFFIRNGWLTYFDDRSSFFRFI